jgi:glutamine synthetase
MKRAEILKLLEDSRAIKVKFAASDIDGILRGKTISIDKFLQIAETGAGFCDVVFGWDANDSCYDNVNATGWHTGYPDATVRIDLSTLRNIPWDNDLAFFLADFSNAKGEDFVACPRSLLRRISKQASEMGFLPLFSEEFEWYNFMGTPNTLDTSDSKNLLPISPGMFGYSMLRPTLNKDYYNNLFDYLARFDIPLEGLHTETGPGVYEASIVCDEVVKAADKAILFKNSVKEIASLHGIVASFMAKWNSALPGNGGHLHQSLWNASGRKNLFFDAKEKNKISALMRHYIAGQLFCLPQIMPMYAPTINSYKRLGGGSWAPNTVSWGFENRTAAIRVITFDEKATRCELRVPGADCNPYLAMAASLASGLYGIRNKLELKVPAIIGNGYESKGNELLPMNLLDATRIMKKSKIAGELFGEDFVGHFINTREWEWRQFEKQVTSWELKRYLEII